MYIYFSPLCEFFTDLHHWEKLNLLLLAVWAVYAQSFIIFNKCNDKASKYNKNFDNIY